MTGSKFGTAKSTSFEEIPVIDISTIQTAEGFERIAEKLVHTAKTVGFFYITGHGISEKLIEQVFATSKRFFKLPVAKKSTVSVDKNQRGWMGQGMAQLEVQKLTTLKKYFFGGGMWTLVIQMCLQAFQWYSQISGLMKLLHLCAAILHHTMRL